MSIKDLLSSFADLRHKTAISFVDFTGTLSTLTAVHAALPELTTLPNYPGVIKILCVIGAKDNEKMDRDGFYPADGCIKVFVFSRSYR